MAGGWAKDGAIQDQIDSTINDAVALARSRLANSGTSLSECEECDEPIPLARQQAIAGVRLCVACQGDADNRGKRAGGFNRSGSKGSQMR